MHKHLSKSERCKIEVYLQEGFTISAIASKIGRQRSTIRDEITRNSANGRYEADVAHKLAISRKIEQRSNARTKRERLARDRFGPSMAEIDSHNGAGYWLPRPSSSPATPRPGGRLRTRLSSDWTARIAARTKPYAC